MSKLTFAVVLAFALAGPTACKRPGTDRDLQCERYGDVIVEKQVECNGGALPKGKPLTTENVEAAAQAAKATCLKDRAKLVSADCIKALKATSCKDGAPVYPAACTDNAAN